jgi:hypothetical protein
LGCAAAKSAELLPVSVQPSPFRTAAVFVPGAGAGALSEQLALEPYPTRSTISVPVGHEPDSAVVVWTRATLPAVALMLTEPDTSAAGRLLTPFAPKASATR